MKTVLVLEDDENLRELLVDVLDSLDYTVEGVGSPPEAIHFAHEIDFDVMISDIRMAGPTDGLGCLEEIKKIRPSLSCIVMTGFADELAPLRAMQIKVDDYIYKPFDVADILAALERVKKSQQQRHWYRRTLNRLLGQGDPEQSLLELNRARESALKTLFVAVRSGHLYAETALEAWDSLEDLEMTYLTILRNPRGYGSGPVLEAKGRYEKWQMRLTQRAKEQSFVSAGSRAPERVERDRFRRFLERLKGGKVSAEDLSMAVGVRRMPAERRQADPECKELYERMWT